MSSAAVFVARSRTDDVRPASNHVETTRDATTAFGPTNDPNASRARRTVLSTFRTLRFPLSKPINVHNIYRGPRRRRRLHTTHPRTAPDGIEHTEDRTKQHALTTRVPTTMRVVTRRPAYTVCIITISQPYGRENRSAEFRGRTDGRGDDDYRLVDRFSFWYTLGGVSQLFFFSRSVYV